jgi:hypothetical protein
MRLKRRHWELSVVNFSFPAKDEVCFLLKKKVIFLEKKKKKRKKEFWLPILKAYLGGNLLGQEKMEQLSGESKHLDLKPWSILQPL